MKCEEKIWFAYDKDNNEITLDNAIKGKEYICPHCYKILKIKTLNNKNYFYHLNKPSGESKIHKHYKENLISIGDVIKLYNENILVKNILYEYTININNTVYRPDILLNVSSKNYKYIIIEINNTSKKDNGMYNKIYKNFKNTLVLEFSINKYNGNYAEAIDVIYDPVIQNKINSMNNKLYSIYKKFKNNYNPEFKEFEYVEVEDVLNKFKAIFEKGLKDFTEIKCKNIFNKCKSFSSCSSEFELNYHKIGEEIINKLYYDLKYCSKRNCLSKYYKESYIDVVKNNENKE